MEEILKFLGSIHPLSEECQNYLRKVVQKRSYEKKEFILRPDEVCKNLYFIKKGLLRCFYLLNGKEVTDWFFWENDTVVSVKSWYSQTPGDDFIQAVEPCELYFICNADLEHIYNRYIEFNYIGRVLTTKYLLIWHELARNIRFLGADEKYRFLLEERPELLQRVPLRDLATWLDMTPETISRRRGNLE